MVDAAGGDGAAEVAAARTELNALAERMRRMTVERLASNRPHVDAAVRELVTLVREAGRTPPLNVPSPAEHALIDCLVVVAADTLDLLTEARDMHRLAQVRDLLRTLSVEVK